MYVVLLFTGITLIVSSIPRKYYSFFISRTWSDARAYCRANYDDLAIIDSNANMLNLKSYTYVTGNMWIGAYLKPNSFLWSNGNQSLGTFTNWISGYPGVYEGKFFCVMLTPSGWYNEVCTLLRPFICYDGE